MGRFGIFMVYVTDLLVMFLNIGQVVSRKEIQWESLVLPFLRRLGTKKYD